MGFDGSIRSLVDLYQGDAESDYHGLPASTKEPYNTYLRLLRVEVGERQIDRCDGRDVKRWFNAWSEDGARLPKANMIIAVLKAIGFTTDESVALVHWALFSLAASAWLAALGIVRPARITIPAGLVLAGALETSQLFIESRRPGLWDAAVSSVGVVAGSLVWRGRRMLPAAGWLLVLVLATAAAQSTRLADLLEAFLESLGPDGSCS